VAPKDFSFPFVAFLLPVRHCRQEVDNGHLRAQSFIGLRSFSLEEDFVRFSLVSLFLVNVFFNQVFLLSFGDVVVSS